MSRLCILKELLEDGNITAEVPMIFTSVAINPVGPTPTRLCDFAGRCPVSPLCFLWNPLPKYLFLHHKVYLLLLSLKVEPLAFSFPDETTWAGVHPPSYQRD